MQLHKNCRNISMKLNYDKDLILGTNKSSECDTVDAPHVLMWIEIDKKLKKSNRRKSAEIA